MGGGGGGGVARHHQNLLLCKSVHSMFYHFAIFEFCRYKVYKASIKRNNMLVKPASIACQTLLFISVSLALDNQSTLQLEGEQ